MLNAVTLLGDVTEGNFQLSARVTGGFASPFDAGAAPRDGHQLRNGSHRGRLAHPGSRSGVPPCSTTSSSTGPCIATPLR
jgi:hypothetical protein